jgi:hypothetical protein
MRIEQAIEIGKAHVKWQKDGVCVPYERLNSELLAIALKVLIDNAELCVCECDGLAVK